MTDDIVRLRAARRDSIDALIAAHGAGRVLWRAARVLLGRIALRPSRRRRTAPPALSTHLRRDIGLEPYKPPPTWLDHMR